MNKHKQLSQEIRNISYSKLIKQKIVLMGLGKIQQDVEEFFFELNIAAYVEIEPQIASFAGRQVIDLNSLHKNVYREMVFVICSFDGEAYIPTLRNSGVLFIELKDLLKYVDELETFRLIRRYPNKKVIVLGIGEYASKLMTENPNFDCAYFVCDNYAIQGTNHEFHGKPVYELEKLTDESKGNFVVVAAEPVSGVRKKQITDMGFDFGSDFYFYNPHKPKKYPSYHLEKTMRDAPRFQLPCDFTKRALSIKHRGSIMACCSAVTLCFGSVIYTSLEEVTKSVAAQIVLLSINNRTYSFCNNLCQLYRETKYAIVSREDIQSNPRKTFELPNISNFNIQLGYDRSCNLACPSCRNKKITSPEDPKEIVELIHEEAVRAARGGATPANIRIGNGELFMSKYYKDIILNVYEAENISLITNGILFSPAIWDKLKNRYKTISLSFSVDAAKQETYEKIRRGGDFNRLKQNLIFAGQLRRLGELKKLNLYFVIQKENYAEMVHFIEFATSINTDKIFFMKINNFGHYSENEFIAIDVYSDKNPNHADFVKLLDNTIFQSPNVHVDNIDNFISKTMSYG